MDRAKDIDIDLRITRTWTALNEHLNTIGLPMVIIPLDTDRRPLKQGHACTTQPEYVDALRQAYNEAPEHVIRLVPVMQVQDEPA
jgi:hypothetical protein